METVLRVHDHDDYRGFVGRGFRLTARRIGELVPVCDLGARIDAGGIHQGEEAPVPIAKRVQAIARDAGCILDDR